MDDPLKSLHSARDAAKATLEAIELSIINYQPPKVVLPRDEFSHVSEDEIVEAVGMAMRIPVSDILGHRRVPEFVRARHILWYLLKEIKGYSLSRIGNRYGVDHSTVSHGISRVEKDYGLMAEASVVMYQGLSN